MNFFSYKSATERYAQYRPYFHPLVIEKIKTHVNLSNPVSRALDIGCGTGQSTIALKEIAEFVIGVDISTEMLDLAKQQSGIEYMKASAEDLSMLKSEPFDLITSSMAYHWFDHNHFLIEMRRLLRDDGWLIIYSNWFSGQMAGNASFKKWAEQSYAKHYPTPPRNKTPLTPEIAREFGFTSFYADGFENDVQFTPEELSAYLSTQSNVISIVEEGNETIENVYSWLTAQTSPYFVSEKATFVFNGYIWYLQK